MHVGRTACEGDKWTACVKEIDLEGAYLIKNHRNSLLFGYYILGFRCLELNLFTNCFDLKDLNLNGSVSNTRANVPNVCCLRFQIRQRRVKKQAFIFRNEQNPVPYIASRERTVRLVENMGYNSQ